MVTHFDPCGYPFVGRHTGLPLRGFYNLYLFLCQSIQLIDQIINVLVNGVDLAFEGGFFVGEFRISVSFDS